MVSAFRPPLRSLLWTARPRYAYVWFCFYCGFHSPLRSVVREWEALCPPRTAVCWVVVAAYRPTGISPRAVCLLDMIVFPIQPERNIASPRDVLSIVDIVFVDKVITLCVSTHANRDSVCTP